MPKVGSLTNVEQDEVDLATLAEKLDDITQLLRILVAYQREAMDDEITEEDLEDGDYI